MAILSQVLLPNAMAEILDRDGVLNEIASKTKVPSVMVCDSWGWELVERLSLEVVTPPFWVSLRR